MIITSKKKKEPSMAGKVLKGIAACLIGAVVCITAGCAASPASHNALYMKDFSLFEGQAPIKLPEIPTEADVKAEPPSEEEIQALGIPENMLAYWMVLNSKKPLVSANEGCQEFYWDEYFWRTSDIRPMYKTTRFGIVDLDNDGSEEIVLTGLMPENTQVLDYQEEKVYSYQFAFRGMKAICTNGIYNSSSAADISGFHRIASFDKGTYEVETLAYMRHDYYEVEGVEVSEKEFFAYTKPFIEAERMKTMDFTEEICDENNPQMADVPEAYLAVLTGREEFICATEEGRKYRIDGNSIRNPEGEETYQVLYFSMVDMEGDGKEEVVLTCVEADGYGDKTLVLHAAKDSIYGYIYEFYDEMGVMETGGVFRMGTSYETYKAQYGKVVSFEEDGCRIEPVEGYDISRHERIRYYYFSEEAITQWLEE